MPWAGSGRSLEVDDQTLSDIKLAVTEACTNVVVHAYPERRGPDGTARVDRRPPACRSWSSTAGAASCRAPDSPGLGLGLPLIATLAESLELGTGRSEETEVRMTFDLGAPRQRRRRVRMSGGATANEAVVRIRSGPLVGAVLGRVVGMLAARAQCPIDRLDDAILLTDAVAAHAPVHARNGHVCVVVAADDERLELRVADLRPDGAQRLLADGDLPGVGNVFDRVADEVQAGTMANGDARRADPAPELPHLSLEHDAPPSDPSTYRGRCHPSSPSPPIRSTTRARSWPSPARSICSPRPS